MMKNAFIPSTSLRSLVGMRSIIPLIFIRADASTEGRPVRIADPRSAEYSRYRESALIRR